MDGAKRRSWEAHIARLRRATPDERLRAAAAQRRISIELLKAGLRARFPDLDQARIDSKAGELIHGAAVWRDICERRRTRGIDTPAP